VRIAIVSALLLTFALAGCSSTTDTIKPDGAEKSVTNVVARQTGFTPTDVSCPADVEAKEGGTFLCHFTGPEPKPYTAQVRIVKVDGEKVNFLIRTRPTAP
jgi:Domain of unknown function (DUF4333)